MKRVIYIITSVIIIALGIVFLTHFLRNDNLENNPAVTDEQGHKQPVHIQPAPVRVGTAFLGELIRRVTSSGTTEAFREIEIKSRISAPVKRVYVDVGKRVQKNELLVELDDQEYRIALQEAKAKLTNARLEYALMKKEQQSVASDSGDTAELERLRKQYQTAKAHYKSGVITIEEFLKIDRQYQIEKILAGKARDELMEQKSGLTSAEAQYTRAEYNLESCRITASFEGIVGNLMIQTGDLAVVNQTLMQLVDLCKLKLKLQVMEGEIRYIKEGETIRAQFAAFPDTVFVGRIVGINPIIDESTRTCTVVAEIDNPEGILKSGMYATAQIIVSRHKDRFLVPRDAVIVRDQRKLVFVVRENKAVWCYVDTGIENDEYIEIKSSTFDLQPGERVIVEGQFALAHNAPVTIIGNDRQ